MSLQSGKTSTIHPFFWLVLPVFFILAQFYIEVSYTQAEKVPLHSEGGPHETMQSIFLGIAFLLGMTSLFKINWSTQKLLVGWFALASLCCFYVFGEEISWGQHILNWNTPDYWAQFNDQNETNLHNTSAWLDQKPRLILFAGIVIGGLVIPALRRWKPAALPQKFAVLFPPDILAVTALGVLVPYMAQEIAEGMQLRIFERVSELQELYMYYFVMLYLWDLRRRAVFPK